MNTELYSSFLSHSMYLFIGWIVFFLIAMLVMLYFFICDIRERDKEGTICNGIVVAIVVFCVIACTWLSINLKLDISKNSYIKYEGEYFVESSGSGKHAVAHVRFSNESKTRRYEYYENPGYLPEGHHEGYVIYSKRSKRIVDWGCDMDHSEAESTE